MSTIVSLLVDFFAQGIVIVYPGVFVFWFIMHLRIERWRKVGRRSFWIAGIGWPLTAGPLLYYRSEVFAPRWLMPPAVQILGVLLVLLAMVVFRLARNHLPFRTMVGVAELEPDKFRQPMLKSGIYSRTRNPIYFAHLLFVLGAAAISGYVANWILFALDCVFLPLMILAEERELRARFGSEFVDYMARVPRLFPKLR